MVIVCYTVLLHQNVFETVFKLLTVFFFFQNNPFNSSKFKYLQNVILGLFTATIDSL